MTPVKNLVQQIIPARLRERPRKPVRGGPKCEHVDEARVPGKTLAHPHGFFCRDCGTYFTSNQ